METVKMARKSNEQFTKEVKELTNGEYVFKEEYKGGNLRIEALHVECGETFKVKPTEFLRNNKRCPRCVKKFQIGDFLAVSYAEEVGRLDPPVLIEISEAGNTLEEISTYIPLKHEVLEHRNKFLEIPNDIEDGHILIGGIIIYPETLKYKKVTHDKDGNLLVSHLLAIKEKEKLK